MKNNKKKSPFRIVIDVITWSIFVLLMIIAFFLIYYVIATNIYAKKGKKYEPLFSLYTIVSGSMEPVIHVYDVVVNIKVTDPSTLKEGDVITFYSPTYNKTITHRINGITYENGTYYFKTKGDANLVPDDNAITIDNVIGKVFIRIPQLGRVQFFIYKLGPYLFLLLIPSFGVLIYDVIKMLNMSGTKKRIDKSLEKKEDKLSKEDTDKLKKKIKERISENKEIVNDKLDKSVKKKNKKKKTNKSIVVTKDSSNADIDIDKVLQKIKNGKY